MGSGVGWGSGGSMPKIDTPVFRIFISRKWRKHDM
jgi:hypothetical protein